MKTKFKKTHFSRDNRILLAILFSATMIVATGIQMGNALFPSISRLMNVPISTVTFLVSVWAFTGLLSPFFGPPSDRYGHGLFVLIGLSGFTIGNLLCAIAPNFSFLLMFQVLVGLGYAIYNFSASAVVGDVFSYELRARAVGIVRIAVSVTALIGVPLAAAIAGWVTARGSFGTVGVLCLIVLVFARKSIPRSPHQVTTIQSDQAKTGFLVSLKDVVQNQSAMIGLLLYVVWPMIPTGVFIYLAAWLEQSFALTEMQIGLAFSLAGVGGLIGNALTAMLTDRIGKKRSSLLGMLTLSIAMILLPRSGILSLALVCFVIFVTALEFISASFGTLMTELTPTSRGTLLSMVSLANGVGTGAAPIVMRLLWERGGYQLVTIVLGMIGLVLTVVIAVLMTEPKVRLSQVGSSGETFRDK
jgi:DHA1 family inner membrane transport protein